MGFPYALLCLPALLVANCTNNPSKHPDSFPPPSRPEKTAVAQAVMNDHKARLQRAGDDGQCDAVTARVRKAMAADPRLTDRDIRTEIDHFEKVKGTMPYPSPGTICSLFGFQTAAEGALQDRRAAQPRQP